MPLKKISTDKAPSAIGPYSQGIVANGFLFTAGQIPLDPVAGKIVEGGIVEQTEQVMKNLQEVLARFEASWGRRRQRRPSSAGSRAFSHRERGLRQVARQCASRSLHRPGVRAPSRRHGRDRRDRRSDLQVRRLNSPELPRRRREELIRLTALARCAG